MQSNFLRLGLKDIGKGLVVSVLTAVVLYIQAQVADPNFSFATVNWAVFGQIALSAGVGYLVKNVFSDSEGRLLGKL
jgi:uncharacterized membrane protein YvlD (DUF360 family)